VVGAGVVVGIAVVLVVGTDVVTVVGIPVVTELIAWAIEKEQITGTANPAAERNFFTNSRRSGAIVVRILFRSLMRVLLSFTIMPLGGAIINSSDGLAHLGWFRYH